MSEEESDYKDDNPAFDYITEVLFPNQIPGREGLAVRCLEALYYEEGPLERFHPRAATLLEVLAIRLMGRTWVRQWIENNVTAQKVEK